jgi:hypothetical protein
MGACSCPISLSKSSLRTSTIFGISAGWVPGPPSAPIIPLWRAPGCNWSAAKAEVLCLSDLSNTGAGQPDFGLYVANQVQEGEPKKGQMPERGVIEMKPVRDDAWLTADTKQVSKYWGAYRLVIVTNLRDFLILGEGPSGSVARLETFRLAKNEADFWDLVAAPQKSANRFGRAFGEYLSRALTQSVALREPKDVAWFLASYACDALQRVEEAGDLPALASVRSSLEEALGITFESDKGGKLFKVKIDRSLREKMLQAKRPTST